MKSGLMHLAMHRQLVEQAVNEERARCLEIVERVSMNESERWLEQACRFPRSGEKFRHGSSVLMGLGELITKQIRGQNG